MTARSNSPAARSAPLKDFCRGLPGATEDIKWGDDLIFSVGGKMFAGFDLDGERQFGFKCDEQEFDRLTEMDGIIPAPYLARHGWVQVQRPSALSAAEKKRLLRRSYELVKAKLPKRVQREIDSA